MYDLILRDATILTSAGREVADVAIKDGRIAYVGPHPPRNRTREEISAIGKFLMPGVIDTAVQFDRDGDGGMWERESFAAVSGGVTTVIALPGPENCVVDSATARAHIDRIAGKSWCHYGLWGCARTGELTDIAEAISQGTIVGGLTAIGNGHGHLSPEQLESMLALDGVLGIQLADDDRNGNGIDTIVDVARTRGRHIHLVHLSTAEELQHLDPVHGESPVTAGVTAHHLFLSTEVFEQPLQTHPPVRSEQDRRTLWTAMKRGRLDCIASDHHPSNPDNGHNTGLPGAELLFPLMLSAVKYGRLSLEMLVSLCSEAPARIFGLENKGRIAKGADADLVLFSEGELTKIDDSWLLSGGRLVSYEKREAAPKPDLVIIDGTIVARNGVVVAETPGGRHILEN